MMALRMLTVILALLAGPAAAQTTTSIVAAENFYGDVAQQIGGADVTVTSILSNPDQDPHLFEASPSVARAPVRRRDRDLQRRRLRSLDDEAAGGLAFAGPQGHRRGRSRAQEAGRQSASLVRPADHAGLCQGARRGAVGPRSGAQERTTSSGCARSSPRCSRSKRRSPSCAASYAGTPVTATEPVFGYMAAALGFRMRNERFQLAVMNDTEPRASDVAAFENDLRKRAGPAAVLQQPGDRRRGAAHAADRPAIEGPGRRRDRDRAARQDLPGLDA